ncbi:MAG: HU family DNA-binding protein, partial [Lachnospiraceae bacterium]|nr:HU family DNA-binding protein [Lachnospiraceae bacterium]
AVFDIISEELKKHEKVQIIGFGTFQTTERAARTGRNPRTGEELNIPASITPVFKAGKTLKEAVNVKEQPKKKGSRKK